MSFCPICKYEYDDTEITQCPDCHCDLVDSLPDNEVTIPVFFDESEEYCSKMMEYLHYNQVEDVQLMFVADRQSYGIYTNAANEKQVRVLLNTFLNNELKEEPENFEKDSEANVSENTSNSGPYIKKADKYKDLIDSAISLIIIGTLGDIYLLGKLLGFITFGPDYSGATQVLFTLVMGSLFTVFIIGGILSFCSAKKIKGEISVEEQTTIDIKEKFGSMNQEELDSHYDTNVDEAALYFNRTAYLKALIFADYPDIEETYLEEMIEQIYTKIFESQE